MSPRKVRLVVDTVRGMAVTGAETRLAFTKKGASEPVLKLLKSAIANAEHNFNLRKEDLFVKTITADGGPTVKRMRPRAFGRGATIRNRTTHINLVLGLKPGVKAPEPKAKAKAEEPKKEVKAKEVKAPKAKPAARKKTDNA